MVRRARPTPRFLHVLTSTLHLAARLYELRSSRRAARRAVVDGTKLGDGQIVVALSVDAAFARQLAVALASLSRCTAGLRHKVFVLHDGFDEELITRVGECANENMDVVWIDTRSSVRESRVLRGPEFPPSMFDRLRLPALLPSDVEKVIYLDSDVVVREPLGDLWNADLGNSLVAAVRDPVLPWAASPLNLDWRTLGLPPDMPYFNSGVLVIPLRLWRSEDIGGQALEMLRRHPSLRADQCALNVVAAGRWMSLHPRWNLQGGHVSPIQSHAWLAERPDVVENASEHPAVIHFNKAFWNRPWQSGSLYPNRELWFEDLDRTPWAGWRPGRRVVPRAAKRVARAARVLVYGSPS
jgi:lipopolysaccharide biosynthesis glycosyltransferase